jgi:DNA-binding HxlR family transcriptional regulator
MLTERDYLVLRELGRWRFALSRQIRLLCGFSSQRTCDRRLKLLIEADYINRKHVLYGIPSLYFTTHKGKALVHASLKPDKIKVDQVLHDIAVVDTAIFLLKHQVSLSAITTEKELHQQDGFGVRKHRPDFLFVLKRKTYCAEVEMALKAREHLLKNIKDNFMAYDYQLWIVPNAQIKITKILEEQHANYPNIHIMSLEEVVGYVKGC